MKQAPQQPYRHTLDRIRPVCLPKIVLHLAVPPNEVVTWCVLANCEMTVHGARIWLTRAGSDYDFWLHPGEPALRLHRGERIWLSTDANVDAEISLSMANTGVARWLMHLWARFFSDDRWQRDIDGATNCSLNSVADRANQRLDQHWL